MVAYNTIMHAWLSLLGNDDHVRSMHKAVKPVNCLVYRYMNTAGRDLVNMSWQLKGALICGAELMSPLHAQ